MKKSELKELVKCIVKEMVNVRPPEHMTDPAAKAEWRGKQKSERDAELKRREMSKDPAFGAERRAASEKDKSNWQAKMDAYKKLRADMEKDPKFAAGKASLDAAD